MHTSVNAKMHYVGHLSVNKLNAIKPLPVRKLNMKCLHILQKLKTLMNFEYSWSKAIIFRMLINQIVWELDSLCFSLRYIVHISAWQSWAIYFPLYFIFVHDVQFPCLNPSCMDKETNPVLSLGLLHILWTIEKNIGSFFHQVCMYFGLQSPEKCRNHKDHSTFRVPCLSNKPVQVRVVRMLHCVCNCSEFVSCIHSWQKQGMKLSLKILK